MKRILIPADGSELGDYAFILAQKIAQKTGAAIEIFSVVPAPEGVYFDKAGKLKNDEGEDLSAFRQEEEAVKKFFEHWIAGKAEIDKITVKIGRVNEDIIQYIKRQEIDLVVMGTYGAYGLDELLRGSHTERIVRHSPVPVLSLKCDRSDLNVKDILLVSDFNETDKVDLYTIKEIQKVFEAKLHLLRVNTSKSFETSRNIKSKIQAYIESNGLENTQVHIYCDVTIESGIVNFCLDKGIDFVAIGTHQRKGLDRFFKHSISEDMVKHVWQPILTFPM